MNYRYCLVCFCNDQVCGFDTPVPGGCSAFGCAAVAPSTFKHLTGVCFLLASPLGPSIPGIAAALSVIGGSLPMGTFVVVILQSSTKFCCPLCSFHCVHSIGIEGGLVVALEARPDAIGMTGLTSAAPV